MRHVLPVLLASVLIIMGINCSKKETQVSVEIKDVAAKVQDGAHQNSSAKPDGSFQSFLIYNDKGTSANHYIPSGFMPDGKCLSINDVWVENCHSGKSCIKMVFDVACSKQGQKWAGIYWQNPPNNWGNRKGGFDLTGATKLTFWAKGEKGGERIEEFKMGGVSGDYPDTDSAMIGPVILSNEWREYTIDLRGKDLSYISGGFSWATNTDVNPESCTFYLDNLKYE